MIRLISTWVSSAGALAVAAWIFSGIEIGGAETRDELLTLAVVAAVLAFVNIFVAPVVKVLSLPFIIVSLGLMLLVINAILLKFTAWIADQFGADFTVDGFWTAVGGALVISLVNAALQSMLPTDEPRRLPAR